MPTPYQLLTQAILAIVLKMVKPVLIEEGYQEDYEFGVENHYENRITDPHKIAPIIADCYDYRLAEEGILEKTIEEVKKDLKVGWQCEGNYDTQLWLFNQETLDKEAEERRKQEEKEAVKTILAQYDYDIDKLREACEKADADLEHEIQREDWQCEFYPTQQGIIDAQDLRNERIASAQEVQAKTMLAWLAIDNARHLNGR